MCLIATTDLSGAELAPRREEREVAEWRPVANISENDSEYLIKAELAGSEERKTSKSPSMRA